MYNSGYWANNKGILNATEVHQTPGWKQVRRVAPQTGMLKKIGMTKCRSSNFRRFLKTEIFSIFKFHGMNS